MLGDEDVHVLNMSELRIDFLEHIPFNQLRGHYLLPNARRAAYRLGSLAYRAILGILTYSLYAPVTALRSSPPKTS